MGNCTVALFGEASKGDFRTPYFCKTLMDLEAFLGNPPPHTQGLYFAIQALLFHQNLIFFRVREEGFSASDYINGFFLLQKEAITSTISAIGVPGVVQEEILHALDPLCAIHHSILITSESDLYDYLTT